MNKNCQIKEADKKPIRILYVNGGILDLGGISSYMINYFRHIDKSICHIDFAVHGDQKGVYDDEIENAGSVIYHLPIKSQDYFGNIKALKKVLKEGNYDIVHSHLDAGSYHILKVAKQCGVPVRIAHSHSINHLTENKLKIFINDYYRKNIKKTATHLMACSKDAGKWLFGKNSDFDVVRNAIELNKFIFSEKNRQEVRRMLNIKNDHIIIGHIGVFDTQKNHTFLMDVFSEVLKKNNNYRLICVGDGPLKNEIEAKAKKLGIYDYVYFTGYTNHIEKYYSAFDIFLLPSLFEGLGIVAVEAQVSGLPCILSNQVPSEAQLLPNVLYLSFEKEHWIDSILSVTANRTIDTLNYALAMHYEIAQEAHILQNTYCEYLKKTIYKKKG